ncbi:MAG: glycosyltransferase family 4 protein [Acidobacteriota bacterium]
MRILQITAGAASMYCGSCIRDNALAAALMAKGHDVLLVPLYTPTLTDENNVSGPRVFFGGISIFLQQKLSLFRYTPPMLDRLWDSRWALHLASNHSIPTNPRFLGELTVSMLKGQSGYQRKELDKLLDWLQNQPRMEVVTLPYTLLIGLAKPIREALGCPVCCTLQGEDLFLEGLPEPYRSQALDLIRSQLRYVDRFFPVSHYYAEFMKRYLGISSEKMEVVPLGINLEGYPPTPREKPGVFTIGYFARVGPEKGLHQLCEAYRLFRGMAGIEAARLEVAGYLAPEHKGYLQRLTSQMSDWGLSDEFHYRGVLDREAKIRFLQGLSVLSVPSPYVEPKGNYLLESMACGVPVVQPQHGAFPEIIEKTEGGWLYEPGDTRALAEKLFRLATDAAALDRLTLAGFRTVRDRYDVVHMADRAGAVLQAVIRDAEPGGTSASR